MQTGNSKKEKPGLLAKVQHPGSTNSIKESKIINHQVRLSPGHFIQKYEYLV